ncbi:MAG TPA: bifunctional 5,10-methylenetetrahydrofolate dehydrogenase/5,10-methenyltetrahydrofolate cyclohydrolase, partial [Candidatus Paceibacterota bacterium]|nr:bifunctional 5,10-methylenetetrahydrofolate dehydrogenase/5,10-methenyltetrahydrofolate cyclohydrolase [Candidatus Paceibacterota bacterium]
LSADIADELRRKMKGFKTPPTLAIVQVGDRPESNAYILRKKNYGESIGATVIHVKLPENISEASLLKEVEKLNQDKKVNGIIVQQPLPKHIDKKKAVESVAFEKDVDGLRLCNVEMLYEGASGADNPDHKHLGFIPATAKGVMTMLKSYKISLEGKRALVIGRSMLVGRPVALLLLNENATVTIAHSKTKNLKKLCLESDIIVAAVGSPKMIKKGFFKKGQVIVDVGINAVGNPKEGGSRKLVGDVDFNEAMKVVSYISPVPGGAGPMTVVSLFENLLEAKKEQE